MALYKKLDLWSVSDGLDKMMDYCYNGNEKDSPYCRNGLQGISTLHTWDSMQSRSTG